MHDASKYNRLGTAHSWYTRAKPTCRRINRGCADSCTHDIDHAFARLQLLRWSEQIIFQLIVHSTADWRHVQIWQTHAAVELAQRIHPSLVQPDDSSHDKYIFRKLAVDRGVPAEVAFAPKNPMQVSSGLVGAIVDTARRQLARDFGQRTYSSPLEEPLEFTVARLYLQRLEAGERE